MKILRKQLPGKTPAIDSKTKKKSPRAEGDFFKQEYDCLLRKTRAQHEQLYPKHEITPTELKARAAAWKAMTEEEAASYGGMLERMVRERTGDYSHVC